MHILFLLGVVGSAGAAGWWLNNKNYESADLNPTFFGFNAQTVTGIGGLALYMLGGPLGMVVGSGLMAGSLVSYDSLGKIRKGFDQLVEVAVKKALADQGGGGNIIDLNIDADAIDALEDALAT